MFQVTGVALSSTGTLSFPIPMESFFSYVIFLETVSGCSDTPRFCTGLYYKLDSLWGLVPQWQMGQGH